MKLLANRNKVERLRMSVSNIYIFIKCSFTSVFVLLFLLFFASDKDDQNVYLGSSQIKFIYLIYEDYLMMIRIMNNKIKSMNDR